MSNTIETIIDNYYAMQITSLEDVQDMMQGLAAVGVSWHPDDKIQDLVWDVDISDVAQAKLVLINDEFWSACADMNLDIYEEMMQAHVRAFGEKSAFYPEHIAFGDRWYLATWEGYEPDEHGAIKFGKHMLGYFSEDNGYDKTETDMIASLGIADKYSLVGHTVMRIR